ncbi:hypothetical protein EV360DRAFT_69572 [Lentinula raphanica]|nr:hypothetical protein EV360DRAFT_69572 [Lentinula raphanica]
MANPPVATRPNPTPATLSTSAHKPAPSMTQKSSAQPARNGHPTDNTLTTAHSRSHPPHSKATSQTHTGTRDLTEEQREDLRRKTFEEFSKQVESEWKGIGKSGCHTKVIFFSWHGISHNISMTVDVTAAINNGIQDEIDQQRRDAKAACLANRRRKPQIEHDETEDSEDEQLTEKHAYILNFFALEPKIQATRRGNAKIRGIKSLRFSLCPLQSYHKKDGKFHSNKFYEWMVKWIDDAPAKWREKTFKKLNMDIFDAEDDEDDDEPSLDSDLVLLQQHMKDYVDSDDEQDISPTSNPSASNRSSPNTNINGVQDARSLSAPPPGAMNTSSAEIQADDDFYEDPAGNAQDEEEEAPVRYHPPKLSRHRGNVVSTIPSESENSDDEHEDRSHEKPVRRAREDNEIDSNDGRASKRKKQ